MKFCVVYLVLFSGLLVVGTMENDDVMKPRLIEVGKILLKRAYMVLLQMARNREPVAERNVLLNEANKLAEIMAQLEVPTQDRTKNLIKTMSKLFRAECDLSVRLQEYAAAHTRMYFRLKNLL